MKVSEQKIDDVNSIIKVEVEKNDYQANVDKSLQQFRQKANIPGFRPGKIPAGLVKKMYGKSVLAEEINKLVSKNLFDYIKENKLNVLGEPLPNETEQKELDFDTQEDFDFLFDVGIAPKMDITLSKKGDKVNYYKIKVDDDLLDKQVKSYTGRYGTHESVDDKVDEKDMVKGLLSELDENGIVKADGISVESAVLMPAYIKDEEEKAKFIGAKKGDKITMNPNKAYSGNEGEISSLLQIAKEEAAGITGDFCFEIADITRYKDAEIGQELFDKAFGEGVITTEADFMAKVKSDLENQFADDSDYKFMLDANKYLIEKVGQLQYPDAFLKRWLLATNEKSTSEDIEKDYPNTIKSLTRHLIQEQLLKDNDIKVEEADLIEMAKKVTRMQFANYGLTNIPDEMLENYAKEMLNKKESAQNLINRSVEEKLTQFIKENVSLKEKEVSLDEFNKLFTEDMNADKE